MLCSSYSDKMIKIELFLGGKVQKKKEEKKVNHYNHANPRG